MNKQGVDREEIVEAIKQIYDKYLAESDQYYAKNDLAYYKAMQKMMSLLHKTAESNFVSFARSLNVVLYNANDFRNFYQFSA